MDALELLLTSHARTHAPEVAQVDGDFSYDSGTWRDLTEAQCRQMPHGLNSIAWLVWHMARTEDVAVNLLVGDGRQVFDGANWAERLRVPIRDIGTNMSKAQVAELSQAVDVTALRAYRAAVGRRTREVARALQPAQWREVLAPDGAERVRVQQGVRPQADWVAEFWIGRTAGWVLDWVATGHNLAHLGQARMVRSLILRTADV